MTTSRLSLVLAAVLLAPAAAAPGEDVEAVRQVVLPESGHMTFVDQPALFLQAVGDFLRP